MTQTVIIEIDGEQPLEKSNVAYAEEATRSRDGESGVAIQFDDAGQTTEFIVGGRLRGSYPADGPRSGTYAELTADGGGATTNAGGQ